MGGIVKIVFKIIVEHGVLEEGDGDIAIRET